jgi:nitrogen fixation protein FixH
MLKSADFSAVATFIANNFLCSGSRIMTDSTDSTLRATVGTDPQTIVLSKGVFVHGGKCSQLDGDQVVNITGGAAGNWGGAGQVADVNYPRWDVICVKNNVQAHTAEDRWFVDDSVVPNTYSLQSTNTYINKAYYDIKVVHGTAEAAPSVPDATADYWTVVEVYVPKSGSSIVPYDTTQVSLHTPVNWDGNTRVLRMEFWSTKFSVDHDPSTGHHRTGGWYIGSTAVATNATELNALNGINVATVTAANLTKLTDGSRLSLTELHMHGYIAKYILIKDVKPSGTDGGSFIKDTWQTRILNTLEVDDTGSVVLASNQLDRKSVV